MNVYVIVSSHENEEARKLQDILLKLDDRCSVVLGCDDYDVDVRSSADVSHITQVQGGVGEDQYWCKATPNSALACCASKRRRTIESADVVVFFNSAHVSSGMLVEVGLAIGADKPIVVKSAAQDHISAMFLSAKHIYFSDSIDSTIGCVYYAIDHRLDVRMYVISEAPAVLTR